jgi:outer membrane protein insertion porin family
MLKQIWKLKISNYIAFFAIIFAIHGCSSTKLVPPTKHLLIKNKIKIKGDKISNSELDDVLKQKPNVKILGMRLRLALFNSIDSAKAEHGRIQKLNRLNRKNNRKIKREIRINERRRQRAIRKGYKDYIYKRIELKDTLDPNLTFRQLIKYRFGEAPVIADTGALSRSQIQIQAYMHSKGYFYSEVTSRFDTIHKLLNKHKTKKKVIARYNVITGIRYYIDTVKVICDNPSILGDFNKFLKKETDKQGLNPDFKASILDKKVINLPFDADKFKAYRTELARYMRDQTYYGFIPTNISYKADTMRVGNNSNSQLKMSLTIVFGDRAVQDEKTSDTIRYVKHLSTKIKNVYFHFCDTSRFKGNFREEMKTIDADLKKNNFLITRDSFLFKELKKPVENYAESEKAGHKVIIKSEVYKNLWGNPKDSIDFDKFRIATFYYNGQMFVHPNVIESQNYLENENYYKEYYLERSFSRLVQLGLFSVIKPEIVETFPGSGIVEVHYYLVPATKQSFSFEPRAKNSNGFLGLTASLNYSNKNIFRSGTNFTFSISGGFESNPSVFAKDDAGQKVKTQNRSFNTIEIGPSVKLDIPGLFPFGVNILSKRQRPRTELSAAYNYQKRPDFSRGLIQFNYLYKFLVGKTQSVSFGLPGVSVIKYVSINPQPEFEAKINALNDLYLKNAYRNQFIWEDFKITFDFDNQEKVKKISPRLRILYSASFSIAGNVLNAFTSISPKYDTLGHKLFLGVSYAQFSVFDNKLIAYLNVGKNKILAFRTMAGIGFPMKNSPTSLPYDYSFFGGGSNDNRGWSARSLGVGSYQQLLDSNFVITQIGDVRFNASLEFRFGSGGLINHAIFVDAGNIWTVKNDPNRPGGQISAKFLRELGISVGYGLRLDFNYFIIRADLGIPIHNPSLPEGERWIYSKEPNFYSKAEQVYGPNYQDRLPTYLFQARLNFGIGFPF